MRRSQGGERNRLRLFGSWEKALKATGLQLPPRGTVHNKKWTKEKIVAEIQRIDCPLRYSDIIASGRNNIYIAAQKLFGSWENAVVAAGLKVAPAVHDKRDQRWTREKVLSEIRRLGTTGHIDLARMGRLDLYYGARTAFGSWRAALAAAGYGEE